MAMPPTPPALASCPIAIVLLEPSVVEAFKPIAIAAVELSLIVAPLPIAIESRPLSFTIAFVPIVIALVALLPTVAAVVSSSIVLEAPPIAIAPSELEPIAVLLPKVAPPSLVTSIVLFEPIAVLLSAKARAPAPSATAFSPALALYPVAVPN